MDHEHDILISAYLDGELHGDEKARVEQLLASDAEARQLRDDLRALRGRLGELPKHRLGPDFAAHVAALAEREFDAVQPPAKGGPAGESGPLPSVWKSWRGIAWAAAALAAALLIMVNSRTPDSPHQLAFRPHEAERGASDAPTAEMSASKVSPHAAADQPQIASRPAPSAPGKLPGYDFSEGDISAMMSAPPPASPSAVPATGRNGVLGDGLLVVRVDVSREALDRRLFEEVLTRHQIVVEPREDDTAQPAATGSLEVVYVEAWPDQIQSALEELRASPKWFRSVALALPEASSAAAPLPQVGERPATASEADGGRALRFQPPNDGVSGRAQRVPVPERFGGQSHDAPIASRELEPLPETPSAGGAAGEEIFNRGEAESLHPKLATDSAPARSASRPAVAPRSATRHPSFFGAEKPSPPAADSTDSASSTPSAGPPPEARAPIKAVFVLQAGSDPASSVAAPAAE